MKTQLTIAAAVLTLAACTPKFYPPQIATPESYVYGAGFSSDTTGVGERWWELFGDTTLDALVEQALANNRDVAVAAARVQQARANLKTVRAQYLPQIGFGARKPPPRANIRPRRKSCSRMPSNRPSRGNCRCSGRCATPNGPQRPKSRPRSGLWRASGSRWPPRSPRPTSRCWSMNATSRQTLRLRRESAALIDSMFRYGMSDGVALEQARSLVYTAEADIPQYCRAVEQTWLSMGILLGETPSRARLSGAGLRLLTDYRPADIPVGLPSELLKRRPDIRQAHFNMLQAAAQAGQARSARFPSISLTAKGGVVSSSIKGLTAANPWAWDALGSVAEPIFGFGKLRNAERAAMAAYTQSAKTYEQTVLTAFADVEKALVAIATYRSQTERTGELVLSNDRIATMTRALYRSGLSDYLDVIDAERSLYQSQMSHVNLVVQQYINYVTLCKALGGGWVAAVQN